MYYDNTTVIATSMAELELLSLIAVMEMTQRAIGAPPAQTQSAIEALRTAVERRTLST